MMQALNVILSIQELDMNMFRLLRLKKKRQNELDDLHTIRKDLQEKQYEKEHEVLEIKKNVKLTELRAHEVAEKVEKLEAKQSSVKKVDEFTALSQEITREEREKANIDREISELNERLASEEEVLVSIRESLESTAEGSEALEKEIHEGICAINQEGREIQEKREKIAKEADAEIFSVYERLVANKGDRVVVPLENRACSGCHIVVTPQHENLVRKGERLVFCEHCSRIHYWQEAIEPVEGVTTRRRRRATA